jgi:adhesin transport system outer membrane protein
MREQELTACAERYLAKHLKAVGEQERVAKADPGKGFELEQIRTRAVYARSLVTERHAALKAAEATFRELTGAVPEALELPGALEGEGFTGLDEALAVADAQEPSIGATRQRAAGTLAARKQAEAGLQPTFSLESLYRLGIDRDGLPGRNDEGYVGVQASFSLSTGGAPTAAIRAARADELAAAARLEGARRNVREGVRLAWQHRQGLIAKQPLVEAQLGWSGKVVEGFQQQFKAGRRSALELLTVQDQAYQAETDAIAVRFERRLADFELARREGTLSRWLPSSSPR